MRSELDAIPERIPGRLSRAYSILRGGSIEEDETLCVHK